MLEITIFNSFSFFCALWPVKVCKFFTLLNICGSNPEWHLTSADSCTNIFQVFKMIHTPLMATKILSQLCLTMWPGHCSMFMGPGFCFYAAVIIGPCSDSHPLTAALCSKAAFFALCDNTLTLIITAHFHPRYSEIEKFISTFRKYPRLPRVEDIEVRDSDWVLRRCGPVDTSNDTWIRSCSSRLEDILIFCSDARSEICFLEFIYLSSGESAQEIFEPREEFAKYD